MALTKQDMRDFLECVRRNSKRNPRKPIKYKHVPGKAHPKPQLVYFIVVGDVVKIGRTKNLTKRIEALRVGLAHPIDAVYFDSKDRLMELEVHKMFAEDRLLGEWFRLSDALRTYLIKNVATFRLDAIQTQSPQETKEIPNGGGHVSVIMEAN